LSDGGHIKCLIDYTTNIMIFLFQPKTLQNYFTNFIVSIE
jgi:hypothetical protein